MAALEQIIEGWRILNSGDGERERGFLLMLSISHHGLHNNSLQFRMLPCTLFLLKLDCM